MFFARTFSEDKIAESISSSSSGSDNDNKKKDNNKEGDKKE